MTLLIKRGTGQPVEFKEGLSDLDKRIQEMRVDRNMLLSETDWWGTSGIEMSDEQKEYRKKLRDLPSDSTPKLDKDGNLTGVTWPIKPE